MDSFTHRSHDDITRTTVNYFARSCVIRDLARMGKRGILFVSLGLASRRDTRRLARVTRMSLVDVARVRGAGASTSASRRRNYRASRVTLVRASSSFGAASASKSHARGLALDRHLVVDRYADGLRQLHASPDVFVIDEFLSPAACEDVIARARAKGDMTQSPVVYAGWTRDVEAWTSTVSSGPAVWVGALAMLIGSTAFGQSGLGLLGEGVVGYLAAVGAAYGASMSTVAMKEAELRELRTSTSTALDGSGAGERELIRATERLLPETSWTQYEAPTVIRYEPGQKLAPHFDANQRADVEDADRGGQTLATLLVYLNDVDEIKGGGQTVFGRLEDGLAVQPAKGRALLFFPANVDGEFDERVEHEGAEATEEKWIVRVWVHQRRVGSPCGLPDDYASL
ncbi:Oxoglutarate/iron-dependent dioxygenase [Ostreococcus tauri]|uniref:Oxoglutarate/iron-dependent dioxygenase n=2 Tax=Ostreococcus tauri TaxID=70448 RepID=A0A090M391_OSTTA|nr:Oxoglutarate/iron-dependent dioxygenase [Ostreococcus tauri]CEF98666.1 Oxoglutarate/iron-dependent dioxygenase [Ostreococcus tauri]|eukprot:XP_003080271.2 Oxoglutarate/iron-dependent dioxygenase [Ostreococcus tauri]